eukprot:1162106-Pelagomonas_calceolata.AAC.5
MDKHSHKGSCQTFGCTQNNTSTTQGELSHICRFGQHKFGNTRLAHGWLAIQVVATHRGAAIHLQVLLGCCRSVEQTACAHGHALMMWI